MYNTIAETEAELNSKEICKCKFFTFSGVHLAKVVKCYDGDTIHCVFKIDGTYYKFKIRMEGYDSAEMKPSLKIKPEIRNELKAKALLAKQRLEDLVLNKNIYLFCNGYDKYGRILGTIRLKLDDVKSVNDMMIEEGFGYDYHGKTKKDEEEQLEILK